MKRILTLFALLGWVVGYGQLYDANWVPGYLPLSTMNFVNNSVILDSFQGGLAFTLTNACISDEQGNFLYYTNGISINNAQGIVPNGDNLSPCWYTDQFLNGGLNINQAALFIPQPDKPGYYFLFHFSNDALDSTRPGTLYYSIIKHDISGYDTVVLKNISFFQDTVLRGGGMTACKHANGRDYWLVMGASVVNKFYKFLVTREYIYGPYVQSIGPEFPLPGDNAYSKFSQDGSKYATGAYEGPVIVMDFDRCSGEFSNPDTIFNQACNAPNSCNGSVGLEFSPNGRFLYVANVPNLNQYDLWAGNIQDSTRLYAADSSDFFKIDMLQDAPNGKLYGCTWNGGAYFYHVVNYPDLKGDSCNFVYGGQPTFSESSWCLSNLINYKLGPLAGSGCDTILSLNPSPEEKDLLLRIQPNPADKYVYVEMGTPASGQSGRQGNYEFDLLNALGQLIATKQTRQVDIFDTEGLANGVYYIREKPTPNPDRYQGPEGDLNTVITRKLVVQH